MWGVKEKVKAKARENRKVNDMPIYDFECACGYRGEHIAKISGRVKCPNCSKWLKRLMPCTHGINMGASGAYGYYDENLGCQITTNKQRREEMKRQGVIEAFGKGWY